MKDQIEALKKEVNDKHIEALAKIDALEKGLGKTDDLEINKWYQLKGYPDVVCFYKGDGKGFGISHYKTWCDNLKFGSFKEWTVLTEEEIKTHLIAEAKRRGFKEGVSYTPLDCDSNCVQNSIDSFGYESRNDALCIYGDHIYLDTVYSGGHHCGYIYSNGQWATIVEQDPVIKIGRYEAKWINSNTILKVGCKEFPFGWVSDLRGTMANFGIQSVQIQGVEVINTVLDSLLSKVK